MPKLRGRLAGISEPRTGQYLSIARFHLVKQSSQKEYRRIEPDMTDVGCTDGSTIIIPIDAGRVTVYEPMVNGKKAISKFEVNHIERLLFIYSTHYKLFL